MTTYKQLNRFHRDYNGKLFHRLGLLRKGGYEILEHAAEFIPKAPHEGAKRYQYRLKHASYIPLFTEAIGYVVSALFSSGLQMAPASDAKDSTTPGELPDPDFYGEFAKNADLKSSAFVQILRAAAMDVLIYDVAYVAVDFPVLTPQQEAAITSLATENAMGSARAYLCGVPVEHVINWQLDKITGKFVWCVLRYETYDEEDPLSETNGQCRIEFKVWRMSPTGVAEFVRYRTKPFENLNELKDDDELEEFDKGSTSFPEIPIQRYTVPDELWMGNLIGPMCEEYFQRRSELLGAMAESNVSIPLIRLGSEVNSQGGELFATVQHNPTRGETAIADYKRKGFTVLGSGDALEFVAPDGTTFSLSSAELKDLREDIFRAVHAMSMSVDNTSAALGRSADSKREDSSAIELFLAAIAQHVRAFATGIYDVVSKGRNEKVVWVVHGLDEFDVGDLTALIEQALSVQTLDIPSPTFKKEYRTSVALKLVRGANPQTKAQMQQEIIDGVDEGEEREAAMREAELTDPEAVKVPGKKPAQKKPGAPAAAGAAT